MEKEQEVERERDRARSTKFFDPKFNFNEPPPKVGIPSAETLQYSDVFVRVLIHRFNMFTAAFKNETGALWEHAQYRAAHSGTVVKPGNICRWFIQDYKLYFSYFVIYVFVCSWTRRCVPARLTWPARVNISPLSTPWTLSRCRSGPLGAEAWG